MKSDNLLRMANRIGDFFDALPDRKQAVAEIAQHMRKFWEPRMRRQILQYVDGHGTEGLSDIVSLAIVEHRTLLESGLSN